MQKVCCLHGIFCLIGNFVSYEIKSSGDRAVEEKNYVAYVTRCRRRILLCRILNNRRKKSVNILVLDIT